jgi:hypothetical protein
MLQFAMGISALALVAAVLLAWNARLLGLVRVILAIGIWNGLGTQGRWPSRRACAGAPPPPTRPGRPPGHPGPGRSPA